MDRLTRWTSDIHTPAEPTCDLCYIFITNPTFPYTNKDITSHVSDTGVLEPRGECSVGDQLTNWEEACDLRMATVPESSEECTPGVAAWPAAGAAAVAAAAALAAWPEAAALAAPVAAVAGASGAIAAWPTAALACTDMGASAADNSMRAAPTGSTGTAGHRTEAHTAPSCPVGTSASTEWPGADGSRASLWA